MSLDSRATIHTGAARRSTRTSSVLRGGLGLLIAGLALVASAAAANNNVLVAVVLLDDGTGPVVYDFELAVQLDDVPGVTSVALDLGATPYTPELDDGRWILERQFATLPELQAAVHGTWLIAVDGSSPSVSTFVLDANGLTQGNFLQPPTDLMPGRGTSDVSPKTLLRWTPPVGASAAYALFVGVGSAGQDQEVLSLADEIEVTATEWQPDELLEVGENEFGLFYVNDGRTFVGDLVVGSGSITWGSNEFAPGDYPPQRPLLALAGEAEVTFFVTLREDFESYALQNDSIGGVEPGEGTRYFVRDEGAAVASVEEALASSAGVAADGANQYWTLGSRAGSTGNIGGTQGFLLIGGLPADEQDAAGAGIFSEYFATPRSLDGSSLKARIRKDSGPAAQVRFLLDDGANEIATEKSPVGGVFAEYSAGTADFVELVDSPSFDFSQVQGVAVEFFVDPIPGEPIATDAFVFGVDDVELPEPLVGTLQLAAVAVLGLAVRIRRRAGQPASMPRMK